VGGSAERFGKSEYPAEVPACRGGFALEIKIGKESGEKMHG